MKDYEIPVDDIAKYILSFAQYTGDVITNLKLQKLLYYAQAWFLVNNEGRRLFPEEIEAWQYGPVIPSIYQKYKDFGRTPIEVDYDYEKDFGYLPENVRQYLSEFCEKFFSLSAAELVGMTHQERPWREAMAAGAGTPISTDVMFEYYTELLNDEQEKSI